ncbi:MAG TPA: RNA methyltransferase [Flavisolibacter sp.]|nr:RNA methyltransferase [Flavisolibacter sp.]
MLSKKEVKDIQSLSHKKFRDAAGLFLAEGPKIVAELAARFPGQVEKIYATTDWPREAAGQAASKLVHVTAEELERISQLHTPNQVLALVRKFDPQPPPPQGFFLYLDGIQDPGNFGTIIRIADWFGISHIIGGPGCADLYNPKVVQATMASIARVSVFEDDGHWLSKQSLPIYAASLEGRSLYGVERTAAGILVIGNESKGISKPVLDLATERITIPGRGEAESLNAAVAAGIILSHLLS